MTSPSLRPHALLRYGLFLLFGLGLSGGLLAAHIVGGDVTYECLGEDGVDQRRYRITVEIYRDCGGNGADFDGGPNGFTGFEMTVFAGTQQVRTVAIPSEDLTITTIDPVAGDPCAVLPPNFCIQRGVYVTELTLPLSDEAYVVSYQRCCRSETISNVVRPGDAGATYLIEITPEAQAACNTSPKFVDYPPLVLCADEEFRFDASAEDPDGDRLEYRLCEPYYGGGNITSGTGVFGFDGIVPNPESPPPYEPIVFRGGFDATSPLDGVLSIDSSTGTLVGRPRAAGQYVVCISALEYRGGVLIGEVRRDFQFNVVACDARAEAGCIVDPTNEWTVLEGASTASARTVTYRFGGDFLREGRKYYSLVSSTQADGSDPRPTLLALRRDRDRVFVRDVDILSEYLLYDFGLQVGETIRLGSPSGVYEVASADSIRLRDGREVRRMKMKCIPSDSSTCVDQTWIEGVGSSKGLLWFSDFDRSLSDGRLLCFSQDDQIRYPKNPSTCFLVGVEEATAAGIEIYPNPFSEVLLIRDATHDIDGYALMDALGRVLAEGPVVSGSATISTAALMEGVYTLVLSAADGPRYVHRSIKR